MASSELARNLGRAYWFWLQVPQRAAANPPAITAVNSRLTCGWESNTPSSVMRVARSVPHSWQDALVFPVSVHRAAFPNKWPNRSLQNLVTSAGHTWLVVWILSPPQRFMCYRLRLLVWGPDRR